MSLVRLVATKSHVCAAAMYNLPMDSTHYRISAEGYPYTLGNLKHDADGWTTYCGQQRENAFCYLRAPFFATAAEALADFRAHYEAADAKAALLRADAFAAIAGRIPVVTPLCDEERFARISVRVRLIHVKTERGDSAFRDIENCGIEFYCSPAEAIAFLECDETNISIMGYREVGMPRDGFMEWKIPFGSKNYMLPGLCRSTSGIGGHHVTSYMRTA